MAQTKIKAGGFDADVITGTTALAEHPASTDERIISDGGTLKRLDFDHVFATPSFRVILSSNQSIGTGSTTKITFDSETWDSSGTFASNKFTPAVAGKYLIVLGGRISGFTDAEEFQLLFYKNGSALNFGQAKIVSAGTNGLFLAQQATIIESLDDDDYIEGYVHQNTGSNADLVATHTFMTGFKLIGV